jgi:hypothetical protein
VLSGENIKRIDDLVLRRNHLQQEKEKTSATLDALKVKQKSTQAGIQINSLENEIESLGIALLASRFEGVLKKVLLATTSESSSSRRLMFAALSLGDVLLACQLTGTAKVGDELTARISRAAEEVKQRRSDLLIEALRSASSGADSCRLAALADLGISNAKFVVTESVFRTPVDGIANNALAILVSWNDQDLLMSLQRLLEHRFSQSFGLRSIARTLVSGRSDEDKQSRSSTTAIFLVTLCGFIAARQNLFRRCSWSGQTNKVNSLGKRITTDDFSKYRMPFMLDDEWQQSVRARLCRSSFLAIYTPYFEFTTLLSGLSF